MDLFELLRRKGLIHRNQVVHRKILSISRSILQDLIGEILKAQQQPARIVASDVGTYFASLELSGSPENCSHFDCRLNKVESLCRFACLYADCVRIINPFAKYARNAVDDSISIDELRSCFATDLTLLLAMKPVLESGRLAFLTPSSNLCPTHVVETAVGREFAERFFSSQKKSANMLLDELQISIGKSRLGIVYTIDWTKSDQDHSRILVSPQPSPALRTRPRLLARLEKGQIIRASKSLAKEIGVHEDLSNTSASNVALATAASRMLGCSFLTRSEIDTAFLNSLNADSLCRKRNNTIQKHLSTMLPFVEDVNLTSLVRLRQRESLAFDEFRSALHEVVKNSTSNGKSLREAEAKEIYDDVLRPAIRRIERSIAASKRDLLSKPVSSLVGLVGVMAFGFVSGAWSTNIQQTIGALGLARIVYDVFSGTSDRLSVEKIASQDQFYFLWKVKQLAKGRK